jgi:hypothetical protein
MVLWLHNQAGQLIYTRIIQDILNPEAHFASAVHSFAAASLNRASTLNQACVTAKLHHIAQMHCSSLHRHNNFCCGPHA